jgi:hypothetical protein
LSIIQLIWKNEKRKFLPSNYVSIKGNVTISRTYSPRIDEKQIYV